MALSAGAPRSKTTAALLAILLGALGAHRFYLRKPASGVIYLIFCWTYIPGLIALVEGLRYAFMSDADFDAAYNGGQAVNKTGSGLRTAAFVIALILAGSFVVGVVAGIAIPAYNDYVARSKQLGEATPQSSGAATTTNANTVTPAVGTAQDQTDFERFVVGYDFNHGETKNTLRGTEFLPDHRFIDFVSAIDENGKTHVMLSTTGTYFVKNGYLTMLRAATLYTMTGKWTRIYGGYSVQKITRADSSGFDVDAGRNYVSGQEMNAGNAAEFYRNPKAVDVQAMEAATSDVPFEMFIAQGIPQDVLQ